MWQGVVACGRVWAYVAGGECMCDKGYGNMAGGGMETYGRGWGHVAGGGVMW